MNERNLEKKKKKKKKKGFEFNMWFYSLEKETWSRQVSLKILDRKRNTLHF
jgi:hypothetical protein